MWQFLGLEELYAAIPGLGGAVCPSTPGRSPNGTPGQLLRAVVSNSLSRSCPYQGFEA